MKRKLIAILLMCILSITACSKEPQESVETPVVVEDVAQPDISEPVEQEENTVEDIEEPIYFSKEETGFLELGDTPVICELGSETKQLVCSDVQIMIDDEWIQLIEAENSPSNIYLGNLEDKNQIYTCIFVERSDEIGINRWVSVFQYENKKFREIGTIKGLISDSFPSGLIEKDDCEKVVSNGYLLDVIQQSYVEVNYKLDNGKIVLVEQDFYDILEQESQDITLLEELIVYESPDVNSKQFTVQPQKVNFTKSDGVEWMEIIAEDGTKGYARADGFTMLDMDNRISTEIFDGLAYWG